MPPASCDPHRLAEESGCVPLRASRTQQPLATKRLPSGLSQWKAANLHALTRSHKHIEPFGKELLRIYTLHGDRPDTLTQIAVLGSVGCDGQNSFQSLHSMKALFAVPTISFPTWGHPRFAQCSHTGLHAPPTYIPNLSCRISQHVRVLNLPSSLQ